MDKRRPRTEEQLEYYANLSDSECDKVSSELESDSSDYEPAENSSEDTDEVVSEPENEVVPELEYNHDASQATTSNTDDNLWTEIQEPEQFMFQQNIGFKLDTTNFTVQTLVNLFFSEEFLALLVEQTNLFAEQEIAKKEKNLTGHHNGEKSALRK
ncbi:hypothetical protein CBL_01779 [Carabus blaptoides fortunei]